MAATTSGGLRVNASATSACNAVAASAETGCNFSNSVFNSVVANPPHAGGSASVVDTDDDSSVLEDAPGMGTSYSRASYNTRRVVTGCNSSVHKCTFNVDDCAAGSSTHTT